MRKLVVTENITIDGVIDASEGWFGAADDDIDASDINAAIREQSAASDAIVVGRVTFEEMRGYWPAQTDDTTGVTDHLNRVTKYVFSTTLEDPGWENSTILRGDVAAELRAIKAMDGQDVVVTGSVSLVHDIIATGLVDEYRLFTYPVVLGRGARLFAEATDVPGLELIEARPFASGVVLLRYRAASSQWN